MKRPELIVVWIVFILLGMSLFLFTNKNRIYTKADAEGYYMYLPALTIFGFDDLPVRTTEQFSRIEKTGRYYTKYTAGVALMQSPFYAIASLISGYSKEYAMDGYSRQYQRMILLSAVFYAMAGLGLLYTFLRKQFSVFISALAVLAIFLGTNTYYYTVEESGMSHIYSFFLWVLLICISDRIYRKPAWKWFVVLSLVISLLVFIRPTNIIASVVVLGWNMTDLRSRVTFIKEQFLKYVILPVPFIMLSAGQLLLWRYMAGSFVLFSYSEEPGFIYFLRPKILQVLFHVHNGLLIYAPILLLSVAGLIIGIVRKAPNFRILGFVLISLTYVIGSWWTWWFGGAFGHRCYVDVMAIFAIGIAYFFQQVSLSRYIAIKWIIGVVTIFFMYYSIRMTEIYAYPWEGPGFMWAQFWEKVKEAVCILK